MAGDATDIDGFCRIWMAKAQGADGVVFDFGGVISVSPMKDWSLYPYCASKGVDRSAMDAGWKRYRHLWLAYRLEVGSRKDVYRYRPYHAVGERKVMRAKRQ